MFEVVFDIYFINICSCFIMAKSFFFLQIASFIANNLKRNWPRDLYESVAQRL